MGRADGVVDSDAVAVLFDRHAPEIFRYCARRVGPDLAEDILGEVFLVAQRRRDRIEAGEQALPWLYGIATNLMRTHRRAELRAYRALARTGVDPLGSGSGIVGSHEVRSTERADAMRVTRKVAAALAQQWVAEQRQRLATQGPNMKNPTAQWLATVDPSPDSLRRLLAEAVCPEANCPDVEWRLWNQIGELARTGDVILPPGVRGGLLRVLATLPGATAEEVTLEGRRYWAVGFPYKGSKLAEFYVDPDTGRIVGAGGIELAAVPDTAECRPTTAPGGSRPKPACSEVPVPAQARTRAVETFWTVKIIQR